MLILVLRSEYSGRYYRTQKRVIVYAVTPAGSPGLNFVNALDVRDTYQVGRWDENDEHYF